MHRNNHEDAGKTVFRVDLHVHTLHSGDNDSEPEEAVESAIEKGLDGIAFTEHDFFGASEHAERLAEKYSNRIKIFRGVEYSLMEGHCLVFGADTDRIRLKDAHEFVSAVLKMGGVVIPAHPFRRGSGLGDMARGLRGIAAIEGHNGCNLSAMNSMAIEMAASMGVPFTGGSDAHLPSEVGSCYTEFQSEVTKDNFLSLLRAGNYRGVDTRKTSLVPWLKAAFRP